jgi:hypothetical protein
MSPATQRRRAGSKAKKRSGVPSWIQWLPLIVGIVAAPVAVWGASILAMSGPSALRLLYPWVSLLRHHSDQLAVGQEEVLEQWVMYGQFPVYGLVWVATQRVWKGVSGLLSVVLMHCLAVGATILLAAN